MKFKGTKGEWRVMYRGFKTKGVAPNLIQIYATNEDLEMVCKVYKDELLHKRTQDFEANAQLIATAPELLKALQELLKQQSSTDKYEPLIKAQKQAEEVINKALCYENN